MVGITYVYSDTIFAAVVVVVVVVFMSQRKYIRLGTQYLRSMGTFLYPPSLLNWTLEHDCLDTCCFGCLRCMCFCIFVFALVQRN